LSRRSCLKALSITALSGVAAGMVGYGYIFLIEPAWLSIERFDVPISGLPPAYHDFRIVCLSDIHHEPLAQLDFIRRVVEQVNELEPDLVCLLGDYVFSQAASIQSLAPILSELSSKQGVFAVLGNHDLWTDAEIVRAGLESHGIRVLNNQHISLDSDSGGIVLAGLDDGWSGEPDLHLALDGMPQDSPVILMLHEPDFADQITEDDRVQLQLSGHSHGGQVRLPFLGAPFLPEYARRYDQGLYQVDGMWLYVSRGVGVISPPGRFNCRPEVTEITLVPAIA
jgi:predicted MPP superfamily phosphohydrolase